MQTTQREEKVALAIEIAIRLGILALVLLVSFLILKPFIAIVTWGIILAVALSPVVDILNKKFDKRKWVIIGMTTVVILSLLIPTYMLSDKIINSSETVMMMAKEGNLTIKQPTEKVKEWPVIGEKAYAFWDAAAIDLKQTLEPFKEQIKSGATSLLSMIGSGIGTIFMFIGAMIIAAVFLISSESSTKFYQRILRRLLGDDKGLEWAKLSVLTVRSVAVGVLGVAVIQASFALLGLILMDVPFAVVLAFAIMFLTIIQLPALIIIGPVIAYVFSYADGTGATIFAIYMLIVGASDGVLKPILMGRGVDIPMLVILIGAIGGMILMGMVGLFVGAVIFALAYKLFELWISEVKEVQEVSIVEEESK